MKLPRELLNYILSIKSFQAWKERLPKLHRLIKHAILPTHAEVEEDSMDLQLHLTYERDYPISNVFPLKHMTILGDWGYESEDDEDELGDPYPHRDHSWILECHSSFSCCEVYSISDCDCSSPEYEEDVECRHSRAYSRIDRQLSSISFTTALWTKRDSNWILY